MDRNVGFFRLFLLTLAGLFAIAPLPLSAETFPFSVEQLGALPGELDAVPWGINARGDVVGWSGYSRAFIFTDNGGMAELFAPGGRPSTLARGINDAGVVVGEASGGGMTATAVRWTAGIGEALGAFGESTRAWDVSNTGAVVGDTPVDALTTDAFIYTDAEGAALLVSPERTSHAYDINDIGHATGAMTFGNSFHVFRYRPGNGIEDLGVLPDYPFSFGKAINISGQIAGSATSASGNSSRVFRFTDGIGMVNLGGVGESNDVWGMNARGDFVGRGLPTSGPYLRAFLYTDEGGLRDFSTLIDPALNLRMLYAHDINDAGQIVGLAYEYVVGRWRAVRLTPTVPVGPLADLSVTPVKIEAGQTCTGWVTLVAPAPAGGALVTLSSGDPGTVSVPASVMIAEGTRHQSFTLSTTRGATGNVVVTAEYESGAQTANVELAPGATTGVGGSSDVPPLQVLSIAPNPTTGVTRLEYELSQPAEIRIGVYDVTGRLIRTLADSPQAAGMHPVIWDGRNRDGSDAPSGLYFVRVRAGSFVQSRKLVLVR